MGQLSETAADHVARVSSDEEQRQTEHKTQSPILFFKPETIPTPPMPAERHTHRLLHSIIRSCIRIFGRPTMDDRPIVRRTVTTQSPRYDHWCFATDAFNFWSMLVG
jgi:hypothetical protein